MYAYMCNDFNAYAPSTEFRSLELDPFQSDKCLINCNFGVYMGAS